MENFTTLINSLLEAKSLKGAKVQLGIAAGVAHVDLPKKISKKFLRIVAEENAAFSNDFLYEEVHYNGGHFWVDSDNFHHWELDEARAYMVLKAANYRRIGGYKNKIYFNLLWKTIAEQEEEEADWKKYLASIDEAEAAKEEEQKENVKYITLDEAEQLLNKAVEEAEAAAAKSKEGMVRPLEEIKALLPRSSRNRVSGLALERALEEGIITPEEAKIISKDMKVF